MVVEKRNRKPDVNSHDDSGQSVLEFLLVLPLLMTIVMLILRVNTVIQMSIVDQKYARSQVLFIAGNSPEYPLRAATIVDPLARAGMNQLIVGVSEDPVKDDDGSGGTVSASTYYIGRRPGGMGENQESGDDIMKRVTVRVRNTVTLCLPTISIGGKPAFEFSPSGGGNSKYNYPEDPRAWQFCSTKVEQRG